MRNRGFTLIEVLVAFTIMAIVTGVTFAAISDGLSQERRAAEATHRVLAARSILETLGIEVPLEEGQIDGELENGETWQIILRAVEPGAEGDAIEVAPALYRVDLTIYDKERPALTLTTLKRQIQR